MRPAASALVTAGGAEGSGSPTSAELGHRLRPQADLVAEELERSRSEGRAQRFAHLGERLLDDVEGRSARHAASPHELHRDSRPLHLERDLLARAVHDDHLVVRREGQHGVGRLCGDGAAELHDQQRHER